MKTAIFILPLSFAAAWIPESVNVARQRDLAGVRPSSSSSNVADTTDASIADFEEWFQQIPGASCDASIRHDYFGGSLRGLSITSPTTTTTTTTTTKQSPLMTIPKSMVLSSDFTKPDWDAQLAQQLWEQVQLGNASSYRGYLSLLTRGGMSCNHPLSSSTAPDALRHWTDQQRAPLRDHPAGRRLLDLEAQQTKQWKKQQQQQQKKFQECNMTWEQFQWAMEVVHSRAFCGDFVGSSSSNAVLSIAAPAMSALVGYVYFVQLHHGLNDVALLGLGALGALPAVWNVVVAGQSIGGSPVAVLLPLIDSANHLEEAASKIEYSPLDNAFTLVAGSTCQVRESNGKTQLYISYGTKKDTELLLNYGFLPGVPMEEAKGDTSIYRAKLAEAFLARNAV